MPSHLRSCWVSSEGYKMGTKFASVQATRPALFTEACCFLVGECHQKCERSRSAATASTRPNSRYSNDTTKQRPPSTRIRRSRVYGREPSSDAPPGAPDGITYPTGSRSALHCRVKADPLAERRAVDLKCVTALGPNPHVDESDAPTLARVQPSSPRAEGFWFPPLSPATRRQAQLPLRPDPSAEADPVRAVQLPTANENRAVVGRFTHPDSLGTSPPALLERAVPLRWEEVQDARDRRKGDVHRAGAEPRLGRDPRKLGRP